jgi:serpin B
MPHGAFGMQNGPDDLLGGPMRAAALLAPFTLALAACGSDPTGSSQPIERLPRSLSVTEQHIASSTTDFGIDLLRRVHAEGKSDNIMLSPLSASMALGMTLNGAGAGGETYGGMARALKLDGLSEDAINRSYRDLIDLLVNLDPAVEIGIANSVWYRAGLRIEAPFEQAVRQAFDAEIGPIDPGSPDAIALVNGWVSEKTNGRIDEIVKRLPPALVALLINAVYFKGEWTAQFDPADTRTAPFTLEDGSTVSVPFMNSGRGEYDVLRNPLFTGLDLGYGGGPYRMTILVPAAGVSIRQLIAILEPDAWRGWMQAFQTEHTTVSMPKYTLEYEAILNDVLAAMGMDAAFDAGRADFTRLVRSGGWISEVKQKTFIEVNEEGTEAAAVTSVTIIESLPQPVVVDRPFIVAIRERLSGTLLFLGVIADPAG